MTIWTPTDDGHADLSSHDAFVDGAPHNTFARLRRDDPMHWTTYEGGEDFWSVTRHADILELNLQFKRLSSAKGIRMEDQTEEEYLARRTFQETDPPEHSQNRKKVSRAFSRGAVAGFDAQIRDIVNDILDRALDTREFDATRLIARELPMRMLGTIIGTPEEDLPWLVEKGDALMANTDPDFTDFVADQMDTDEFRLMPFNSPAGAELYVYARELMQKKAEAGDTDGVLHMILQPDKEGNVMPEREFQNFFCLLVAAGNDTTRYSIAAGIQAMCHQPELLEQMRGDVWETAADEIIRWASPASYFRRTATEDFSFHSKKIREGEKVLLWFASGNRDEAAFDDPFRVRLDRPANHVSFGQGGPHMCLGMWLARLEVRILFQELARRISRIEQVGDHAFVRSNFMGGIKRLPVRITPA
ncbi:MAG: cytochrome P450 [Rhodobacteraceae bacterium]|nr:cytochrome P450 [Paracoccaceae bacterium]